MSTCRGRMPDPRDSDHSCEKSEGHYISDGSTDDGKYIPGSPHRCAANHDRPFEWFDEAEGAYYEPDPNAPLTIQPISEDELVKARMIRQIEQLEIENEFLRRTVTALSERQIIIVNNQGAGS